MQRNHLKSISNHHFSEFLITQKELNAETSSTRKILRAHDKRRTAQATPPKLSSQQLLMIRVVTAIYLINLATEACAAQEIQSAPTASHPKALTQTNAHPATAQNNPHVYGRAQPPAKIKFDGMDALILKKDTLTCRDKTRGYNGGLICKMEDAKEYLLKPIDGNVQTPNGVIFNYKQALYNKQILKMLGIETPKHRIFQISQLPYKIIKSIEKIDGKYSYQTGKANFFFACEWLPNFISLEDFRDNLKVSAEMSIKKIEEQSGLIAYAKYIVACSLVPDILVNTANIGFHNGKWMVVDFDINNIYAANTLNRFEGEVAGSKTIRLSLSHFKMMHKMYQELSKRKVPVGPQYYGMDQENFDIAISIYIKTLEELMSNAKKLKLDDQLSAENAKTFAKLAKERYFKEYPHRPLYQSIF